jgi:hypothetical protein
MLRTIILLIELVFVLLVDGLEVVHVFLHIYHRGINLVVDLLRGLLDFHWVPAVVQDVD